MIDRPVCQVIKLGQVDYQQAWDLQNHLADEIAAGRHLPTLLLLEHPHTFTFGRKGHIENLLWSQEELARRRVKVYWVDRGGDVTYHGPGQLVGYPLLSLAAWDWLKSGANQLPQVDYVGYLRKLEQVYFCLFSQGAPANILRAASLDLRANNCDDCDCQYRAGGNES